MKSRFHLKNRCLRTLSTKLLPGIKGGKQIEIHSWGTKTRKLVVYKIDANE